MSRVTRMQAMCSQHVLEAAVGLCRPLLVKVRYLTSREVYSCDNVTSLPQQRATKSSVMYLYSQSTNISKI